MNVFLTYIYFFVMFKLIKGFYVGVSMLGKCWTVGDLSTVWCWFWCSPAVIHLNLFHMQSILTYLLHGAEFFLRN